MCITSLLFSVTEFFSIPLNFILIINQILVANIKRLYLFMITLQEHVRFMVGISLHAKKPTYFYFSEKKLFHHPARQ